MILTNAQVSTLQKVQALCNQALPRIEFLESLAQTHPAIRERVQELRTRRDYLANLATSALELNRQIGDK